MMLTELKIDLRLTSYLNYAEFRILIIPASIKALQIKLLPLSAAR